MFSIIFRDKKKKTFNRLGTKTELHINFKDENNIFAMK